MFKKSSRRLLARTAVFQAAEEEFDSLREYQLFSLVYRVENCHTIRMKICCRCNKEKSLFEFSMKSFDKPQSYCTECNKKYQRRHYKANKQKYLDKSKDHKEKLVAIAKEKKDVPCADCGNRYPFFVMDFDHVFGEKRDTISAMAHTKQVAKSVLLAEIEKCEVVCSNCHRIRTYNRNRHKAT